ncbi:hypothetical protein CAPTEDRAFT_137768, partial [Capitella teleta]
YKLCMLTFKFFHGIAPSYLTALLQVYNPPRTLRSTETHLLTSALWRTKKCGTRCGTNFQVKFGAPPTVTFFFKD